MISVILTTRNEEKSIGGCLDSLVKQKGLGEVVIADAQSTDRTVKIIRESNYYHKLPIRLFIKPGLSISQGRNLAISKAKGKIIAVTDAGCKADRNWLEEITKPFKEKSNVQAVSGFFKPWAESLFQKYLAAVTIPILSNIKPDKFLPSSRSIAFQKLLWQKVGGYPEWVSICEDLLFDIKIRKEGVLFKFSPKALVCWKPRRNIPQFFRQYYMYAKGDGHAKLWNYRHVIRYGAYGGLFLGLILSSVCHPAFMLLFVILGIFYMKKFYQRFWVHFSRENFLVKFGAIIFIPVLVLIGDVAKMVGYPVGIYQRKRGKIKFESYN